MMDFVVLKFGGTSVSTKTRWETIGRIAKKRCDEGFKPVVVCSALSGVSNLLAQPKASLSMLEQIHGALADDMSLDVNTVLGDDFNALESLMQRGVDTGVQAQIMSYGEILSTRLGVAFLVQQGLSVSWQDARTCLVAEHGLSEERTYLNATCKYAKDGALIERFSALPASIIVTQGFIARNNVGETVLLGRGGSDTSAAYFAAKLDAKRCEIWTDVAGMYTANPRQIPEAQVIKQLDYDEAQEIATMGAKVLHPRCIAPVKQSKIPMYVRCTDMPDDDGTCISVVDNTQMARVKSISTKSSMTLFSVENLGMWQEVGFLADLFGIFKRHGVSIDLVSTSETNVTVSVDPQSNPLTSVTQALLNDLQLLGKVDVISNCAGVSLVGTRIRSILHQLGPVLSVFEEQKVYLVSQAASDLNLTFVVEQASSDALTQKLHQLLFESGSAQHDAPGWWVHKRSQLLELAHMQSPTYVYDADTLKRTASDLQALKSVDRVFFAIKANDHEDILKLFFGMGLGFECVSRGELERIFSLFPTIDPQRILFTPNFAPRDEYALALKHKCHVTLDSLYPLKHWPELFSGQSIFLRLDPGQGKGHHSHVKTAGKQSKFGIARDDIETVIALIAKHNVRVTGLHAHAGSGIGDANHWADVATFLTDVAKRLPDVKVIDLGGGLGIQADLRNFDATVKAIRDAHPQYEFWIEPGRYLVAMCGVLLSRVTQLKQKADTQFVGLDVGMNSLIRPMLYGAYHPIVNLTRLSDAATQKAHVVGPICESGDTLGYDRTLPPSLEGDVFLIAHAGAYGHVMSSHYNRREPATEVLI